MKENNLSKAASLADSNGTKPSIKEEIKSIALIVVIALLIRIFVVEPFHVPTPSMQATIMPGDYIFSTKYSYGFSKYSIPFNPDLFSGRIFADLPKRGDIIIMRPPHKMDTRYIKRLIGLPGDKIEIKNNVTYINDVAVERVRVGIYADENNQQYVKYKESLPNGGISFYTYKQADKDSNGEDSNFGPYIVPSDHFFFMGDNRDSSGDSRLKLGFVPFENLIAKAQFVFLSTKEPLWKDDIGFIDQVSRVWTWLSSIRFSRLFTSLYSL